LSLGQRQRIALALAFLKDSELPNLDETTSSIESKTETLVQKSLEVLWENSTFVTVAYRLSTLNNANRIFVIDNGQIVEQGTKADLI
jgi:subfamily B ATP-binding cassette protein MsbA